MFYIHCVQISMFLPCYLQKNPPEISKLNEFNGYTLIATSNNMLSRLIMQFVVLGFILTGTFKLVSGMSWIYILFIVCLAIFIQVIISNRDYKSFKLNKNNNHYRRKGDNMAFKNRFLIYRKFFIASLVIYILSFISGALISNFLNFDLLPHAEAFDDLLYHNLILGLKLMVLDGLV